VTKGTRRITDGAKEIGARVPRGSKGKRINSRRRISVTQARATREGEVFEGGKREGKKEPSKTAIKIIGS